MKAIIPINLDLTVHVNTFKPSHYNLQNFNFDHALFILSQIYEIPSKNKLASDQLAFNQNYTLISSIILQSYVHNYKAYIDYFIKTQVIECDGFYRPSTYYIGAEKCLGYRFAWSYTNNDIKLIDYNLKFSRTLEKRLKVDFKTASVDYIHLTKWLWKNSNFNIDVNASLEYIELKKNAQLVNPELLDIKKNSVDGRYEQKDPYEQFRTAKINILKISTNNTECIIDDTVKRMHTPYTNINSVLRNFIKYKDEEMCSIDIVNSQPYISLILFNTNKYNKINKYLNIFNQIPPLVLENISQLADNEDVMLYESLVSDKDNNEYDFYTYMQVESTKTGIGFPDRASAKSAMFEVLFSSNRYSSENKKMFTNLFPTVDKAFREIKKNNKSKLACLLQNIESHIVLSVITKRIARKYPKAPLLTIHDSIATTTKYGNQVSDVMLHELTNLVGYKPKLKLDYWSPNNVDWDKYIIKHV